MKSLKTFFASLMYLFFCESAFASDWFFMKISKDPLVFIDYESIVKGDDGAVDFWITSILLSKQDAIVKMNKSVLCEKRTMKEVQAFVTTDIGTGNVDVNNEYKSIMPDSLDEYAYKIVCRDNVLEELNRQGARIFVTPKKAAEAIKIILQEEEP